MTGFHISHSNIRVAFDLAAASLGPHVKLLYGIDVQYEIPMSFDDFVQHIKGHRSLESNQITARIHDQERACA
jgi:hypothetical protein